MSSAKCYEEALTAHTVKRRRHRPEGEDDMAQEGADLATGSTETFREQRHPLRRPDRTPEPLPAHVLEHFADRPSEWEECRVEVITERSSSRAFGDDVRPSQTCVGKLW